MNVLIISTPEDIHAHAVAWAISKKEVGCQIVDFTAFPRDLSASYSISAGGKVSRCIQSQRKSNVDDIDSIWHRRLGEINLSNSLHEDDVEHSRCESKEFRSGFLNYTCTDVFEANPGSAAYHANQKMTQLEQASSVGLCIPETLTSNDPQKIREFFDKNGKKLLFKAYSPFSWQGKTASDERSTYASMVKEETILDTLSLSACPSIYQEYIDKDYEVRVLVMGRQHFAVKINSQKSNSTKVDWRLHQVANDWSQIDLPLHVSELIDKLMDRLNLVTGSFDFIVTPQQDYYFIEVNEAGQFLFLEMFVPTLPALDCFADFLICANREFKYIPKQPPITFQEYLNSPEYYEFKIKTSSD